MKKIIATLLTILIILNIYIPSTSATEPSGNAVSQEAVESWTDNGTGPVKTMEGDTTSTKDQPLDDASGSNNGSAVLTAFLEVFTILPRVGSWVMSKIVLDGKKNYTSPDGDQYSLFTIQDLLFGKFYLFDINVFNTQPSPAQADDPNITTVNNIKENVAIWYIAIRNIAVVGSALILIYVAIRLALAIAKGDSAERAHYNKMITSWLIGIILIFVVQFLVIILLYLSSLIVNFIYSIISKDSSGSNMEGSIIADSWNNIMVQKGINKLLYVVLYASLVYYQLKFFLMYAKRSLETFFLMILAPLVCMLYPIDFIGDGRSQSFKVWIKTLIEYIFLQPIHLAVYAVFMLTADEIAVRAPLIAIIFFASLSNGEKIVKGLFGLQGPSLREIKIKNLKKAPKEESEES